MIRYLLSDSLFFVELLHPPQGFMAIKYCASSHLSTQSPPPPIPSASPQDSKVVDNACIALCHIAEALSGSSGLLAQLCSDGNMLAQALQLV